MSHALFDFPSYSPSFGLSNGHVQSILPTVFRQVDVPFHRAQVELDDGDFLLFDFLRQTDTSAPWVILTHGLEGSSHSQYIQGMAKAFYGQGWNVLAWNFRSCGGKMNRLPRFYHSGAIDDVNRVIGHLINNENANQIFLIGFSMGGNQTVLTLGQADLPEQVIGGAAFSVPLDLQSCAEELGKPAQTIYMRRFLRDLKPKVFHKAEQFPDLISTEGYDDIRNFRQFDDRYTGPIHGFKDAVDYWTQCSSSKALPHLQRPTLIVNAIDDPFLSDACYNACMNKRSTHLFLETPSAGGHVGFIRWKINQELWSEKRAMAFADYILARH